MGEGQFLMGSREPERHQADVQPAHFTPSSVNHGSKMVNSDFQMNRDGSSENPRSLVLFLTS